MPGRVGQGADDAGGAEEVAGHGVDQPDECGAERWAGQQSDDGGRDLCADDLAQIPAAEQLGDLIGDLLLQGILDGVIGEQAGDQRDRGGVQCLQQGRVAQ